MISTRTMSGRLRRLSHVGLLLLVCACAKPVTERTSTSGTIDPARLDMAVQKAKEVRAEGKRVWCVPFARNASGIDIRGDAKTWWTQAKGVFAQGYVPQPGAVMTFKATRKLPLGHVAVVSEVVSEREILVDHANWSRNQVSLGMAVIDVSEKNDWSAVRLMSNPDAYGRVYPVEGFILPKPVE